MDCANDQLYKQLQYYKEQYSRANQQLFSKMVK